MNDELAKFQSSLSIQANKSTKQRDEMSEGNILTAMRRLISTETSFKAPLAATNGFRPQRGDESARKPDCPVRVPTGPPHLPSKDG